MAPQRFRSTPVPATVDPAFDSVFVMDLVVRQWVLMFVHLWFWPNRQICVVAFVKQPPGHTSGVVDLPALLRFSKRINLAVCRITCFGTSPDGGDGGFDPFVTTVDDKDAPTGSAVTVELVSTACIEWRGILATGDKALSIELSGIGDEAKIGVPVGVINAELKLAPSPAHVAVIPQVIS